MCRVSALLAYIQALEITKNYAKLNLTIKLEAKDLDNSITDSLIWSHHYTFQHGCTVR